MRKCYCEGKCPNDMINGTCEIRQGGQCFTAVEEVWDPESRSVEYEYTYGCLPDDERGFMQVNRIFCFVIYVL